MKVLGKFLGGVNTRNVAVGGYMALEAEWVNVETYSGKSVTEDDRCLIKVGASYITACIHKVDGYMSPEEADTMVKDLVMKEVIDLGDYDAGFFDVWDVIPESIYVENVIDEDDNEIPLEVKNV